MSKSLLIVESHNDKFFIERLKTIVESDIEVSSICRIDEYKCLDGLNNLKYKLEEILSNDDKPTSDNTTIKNIYKSIGIILDANTVGIKERVDFINKSVKFITDDVEIVSPDTWYRSEKLNIDISCHILNVEGHGELETILKKIKSHHSTFADFLYSWQECLTQNSKEITLKDFDKFWINIYSRYDCCDKSEQKQAGRKCNLEATLQKDVWDFSHPALNELKNYLAMFN